VGLLALVLFDSLLGLGYRTSTASRVSVTLPREGVTRQAIVVFPGFAMSGPLLAQAFAPYVGPNDALLVVGYAERGVNTQAIASQVLDRLRPLRPVALRVYGASMGGMVSRTFLDVYRQAGLPYGKVALVLDAAPSRRADIRRPAFLFALSCWYRGGPLASLAWAGLSALIPKPPLGAAASPTLVRAARHAGAWVGMPAATSQSCFIAHATRLHQGELRDVAATVDFLEPAPERDPVVALPAAIAGWRVAFPDLAISAVPGRPGSWHLPLMEYPRATVRAILQAGSAPQNREKR
jgi:hypothetical protein